MRTAIALLIALLLALCAPGARCAGLQGALVRVAHAAPTTPPVDIYINGNVFATQLVYGTVSPYLLLPPAPARDPYLVEVRISGAPNVTVLNASLSIAAGTPYTVVALGVPAQLLVTPDAISAPPLGSSLVRFIHASPNAPAVSVLLGQTKLFSKVQYRSVTAYAPYTPVPQTLYNSVFLLPVGSATEVALAYFVPQPAMAYTVIAAGYVGGSGSEALRGIIVPDV